MHTVRLTSALLALTFFAACDDPTGPETPPEVRERIVRALPGDEIQLTVTGAPRHWTSSAEEVATIGEDGIARALAPGWAVIVAEGVERSDTVFVGVGLRFVKISAKGHVCGLTAEAVAYCWGGHYYGELGIEPVNLYEFSPVRVATDQRFVSLSAGGEHTCGITVTAEAFWGGGLAGLVEGSDCDLEPNIGHSDVWSVDFAADARLDATLTSSSSANWKIQVRSWHGDLLDEASSVDGTATVTFTADDDTRYHIIAIGSGEYTLDLTTPAG